SRLYDQAAVCGNGLVLLGRPGVDVGHLEPVIAERNGFRRARDASVVSNRRREPEHPAGALVFENYWRKLVQYVVGIREPRHPRLRDVLDGKRAEPDRIVRSNGEERLGAAIDTACTICLRSEERRVGKGGGSAWRHGV